MTMSCWLENINKEIEIIKKIQTEILELKSTITEKKKLLKQLNSRSELAKESVNLEMDWYGLLICNLKERNKKD